MNGNPASKLLATAMGVLAVALWLVGPGLAQDDPAAAMYQEGQDALRRDDFQQAAETFQAVAKSHPDFERAGDALYWEAFARYRIGDTDNLRKALAALEIQRERYDQARTREDAEDLVTRIQGELARRGDRRSAEIVQKKAAAEGGEDDELKIAALSALLHMDAERAVPILRKILEHPEQNSAELRERAVFLLSQKPTEDTEDLLLSVVRTDPSDRVRERAVLWLSQVPGEKALDALAETLRSTDNPDVQERALFALSQHPGDRTAQILRDFVMSENTAPRVRERAIFWLGQSGAPETTEFLKKAYGGLETPGMKEQVLLAVSQHPDKGSKRWLLDRALDRTEDIESRKHALFWASEQGMVPAADLKKIYDELEDHEMRQEVIYVASQQKGDAAVDLLLEIARTETDPELKRQAVFWLEQSGDPRLGDVLEEILDR
jgi:HEAT repeat protein